MFRTLTAARQRTLIRWSLRAAAIAVVVALGFLALPPLAGVPARLIDGCAKWIALAAVLELFSVLGFIIAFKLVFGIRMTWRQSSPAALRALGASAVLPVGGIVGPAAGAWSARAESVPPSQLTRSSIAFVVLTSAPGVLVLAALGVTLWLGWASGPHGAALSLVPAGVALAILATAWRTPYSTSRDQPQDAAGRRRLLDRVVKSVGLLRDGIADARTTVVAGDWKLVGAVCYYAFDNAVLWAAFHAFGRTPPLSVIVMGYLIGSLGAALPSPAGLGPAEGGLIGALVLFGAPAAPAAAAVLLYRGISLTVSLVLGAVAWTPRPLARLRPKSWARHRRYARDAPSGASGAEIVSAGAS